MAISKTQLRVLWGVRILLALAFGAAGIAKLLGAEPMVAVFDQIGFGQWFRYVTGAVELAGAVALLIPMTAFLAALMLAATMACAILTHLLLIGGSPVPAMVLFTLAVIAATLKRSHQGGKVLG